MPSEAKALIDSFSSVTRRIMRLAHQDLQMPELLHEVSAVVLEFAGCEAAEIYLCEAKRCHRSMTEPDAAQPEYETITPYQSVLEQVDEVNLGEPRSLIAACCSILAGRLELATEANHVEGCFWLCDSQPLQTYETSRYRRRPMRLTLRGHFRSLAAIPFELEEDNRALLVLKSRTEGFFDRSRVELLSGLGPLLGLPIVHRQTQLALRERIKELTCLYGISKLVGPADTPLEQVLTDTVELIPPAWLYPEITSARVVFDDEQFLSCKHQPGCHHMRSDIIIDGTPRGFVEVSYSAQTIELDEGPFLKEERHLIDAIAKELALIVDQYGAEQRRKELQEQLRHADRLATIGELSAGVAHELNEPLGAVLGFAELAQQCEQLPETVSRDLNKIVSAALHARGIVKKLMLFARQSEPATNWLDLNRLVEDGLFFLESRCRQSDIELVRELDGELSEITADPGQIYQVLINLAVNAIQAMPTGGRLTIRTARRGAHGAVLTVADTGCGMSAELRDKIFMPFFTTKDVGEGTGLGLSVVEGIVKSHGGTIQLESEEGTGSSFTVFLPVRGPAQRKTSATTK